MASSNGFREIDQQFEEWQIAVDEWRSDDNRVVALGRLHNRGRQGDVELEQAMAAVVAISAAKLLRLRLFADHGEALEAAGLRPS